MSRDTLRALAHLGRCNGSVSDYLNLLGVVTNWTLIVWGNVRPIHRMLDSFVDRRAQFASFRMRMHRRIFSSIVPLLCFCPLSPLNSSLAAAQVIPPVTGRVVDAVSGKPIGGIALTLQISTYEGFSKHTEVKSTATSTESQSFSLAGWNHPAESPLDEIRSYWLTVNEGFETTGIEESSAETEVLYNPMSNQSGWAANDKRYFPLVITFRRDGCQRRWGATCMHLESSSNITIPLIPTLDDPSDCSKISDAPLRENCRQLNTYRTALLHVGSYEEVKKGKELCGQVDGGFISKTCLYQLGLHSGVKNVDEPIPAGMFPDVLAGLPVMTNRHCGPPLGWDGSVDCAGGYGTTAKQLVAVYVEQRPEGWDGLHEWSHIDKPISVTEEVRTGGKVFRYEGRWYSGVQSADGTFSRSEHESISYVWFSGNTLVEVHFYELIQQREEFLAYYLERFPSTSK